MPDVLTKTQELRDVPGSKEGGAAEPPVLQTKPQVSPELPSSFPAGKIGEVMKGASTICEKIAKYGGELAENNKKLTEATELLGDLATGFAKGAAIASALSAGFAALGVAMGFLNSLLAPDPTAVILKALQGLSEQIGRFQTFVEVELDELKQDMAIQPKLQTISETRNKLDAIQIHLDEYATGKDLESPRAELLRCEDPLELALQIRNTYLLPEIGNPGLLQLLYERTYGDPSRLAPMIYQGIALMMTALRAKALRACFEHEEDTGKTPEQHEAWTFALNASREISPLVESLAKAGKAILQKCESELDDNYKSKLKSLFSKIPVRAGDEATHSRAASAICNALKGYVQYQWHVLVYKDVDAGNWRLNYHDGTFAPYFRQECKDGKACIVVVKSRPPGPDKGFLETLQQTEWPFPPGIQDKFEWLQTMYLEQGALYDAVSPDELFDNMDLREWNVAMHKFATEVPGGKLLYLGIVKPGLNPACATTATEPPDMALWCPLHFQHLNRDDGHKVPIKLICVATAS